MIKIKVVPKGKRYTMCPRLGFIYAEKNGGPCLKTETTWNKISGFFVNTDKGCFWFYFRRYYR